MKMSFSLDSLAHDASLHIDNAHSVSRQIFGYFESSSKHTFHSCSYRFHPNLTKKGTQDLWTHPIKRPQAEFLEFVPFVRNRPPNSMGGAYFYKKRSKSRTQCPINPKFETDVEGGLINVPPKAFSFSSIGGAANAFFPPKYRFCEECIHFLHLRHPLLVKMEMLLVAH